MYSNQSQFGQQLGPPVVHQLPYQVGVQSAAIRRSRALIGLGITGIVVSALLGIWSIWLCFYGNFSIVAGSLGLVCACFHVILGIFAIIGGKDIDRNRCSLITCLVLGIVGCTVFVVAALTTDIIALALSDCNTHCYGDNCNVICYNWLPPIVGVPILIACIIEAIVGIVLSSVTCRHVCICCKDIRNTGRVIRQGPSVVISPQHPYYGYSVGISQVPQNANYGSNRPAAVANQDQQQLPKYQQNPSDQQQPPKYQENPSDQQQPPKYKQNPSDTEVLITNK